MVHYRRSLVPGGTFFFTVTIADRRSSILVDSVASLRHAFRMARHKPRLRRADGVIPDFAALHPGYELRARSPHERSAMRGRRSRISLRSIRATNPTRIKGPGGDAAG